MLAPMLSSLIWLSLLSSLSQATSAGTSQCRCFPGDACWPSTGVFDQFNKTVGGKLIATIPLAAPCHNSQYGRYNATQCKTLQSEWIWEEVHYNSSSSIMAPLFANRSCDPFNGVKGRCVIGTYVNYAVKIENAGDVAKTLAFVQEHNIRVVIRNTGHDYNGKSTGSGAIGIWTHHLKNISIFDYKSPFYSGKAMKMGAGVQAFEAYAAADKQNLMVVGGECPTVGLAGGYSQGGGHSTLSSKVGLGADQVLEWEVVDASGRLHTATRTQNRDLYWALSGGGGGTYGVVLSMTVKAHRDAPTSALNLTFSSTGIPQSKFWQAAEFYNSLLPSIVDAGVMSLHFLTNTSFTLAPAIGPDVPATKLHQLLQPFTQKLTSLGIPHNSTLLTFPTYLQAYKTMLPSIPVATTQLGSRLIPRQVVQNNNSALSSAYRKIIEKGGNVAVVSLNVSEAVAGGNVFNSVNPAWRKALSHTVITTPWSFDPEAWSEMVADTRKMTDELVPLLKRLAPNSGAYINENDFRDPDWKADFYGENYGRLLGIKDEYDPHQVFYALTGVGSDRWVERGDGRLCRAT